jgi:hypothetical protein
MHTLDITPFTLRMKFKEYVSNMCNSTPLLAWRMNWLIREFVWSKKSYKYALLLYFVQSYIGRRPTICWFFHMNPILKLFASLIPCFTMAMSKHQRLWKMIIISHWCLCSWSVEVNDFWLISTKVIKILMLQTILISSRLEPLKIFLEN